MHLKEFNDEIKSGIVLVDFHTSWCRPCKMMEPVLDKLKEVVKIIKVDAEHSADTANHYKIRAVPTIIFFKDGKEESRLEGLQKEDIILGRLAELK